MFCTRALDVHGSEPDRLGSSPALSCGRSVFARADLVGVGNRSDQRLRRERLAVGRVLPPTSRRRDGSASRRLGSTPAVEDGSEVAGDRVSERCRQSHRASRGPRAQRAAPHWCMIESMAFDWSTAATLAAGSVTTIAGALVQARADRQRLVAQRSAEVEGEALLTLQERLGALPDAYYGILRHAEGLVENPSIDHAQFDETDVYPFVHNATAPRREAEMLATRIGDDRLRHKVVGSIALIWPASTEEITAACLAVLEETPENHPFPVSAPDDVDEAIREIVEDIGARLRGPMRRRRRRVRPGAGTSRSSVPAL